MAQFIWPLDDHIITRGFYYLATLYVGGQHAAVDLVRKTGATHGAPVRTATDGVVAGVGWDMYSGFFVAVDHADDWKSWYRHLRSPATVTIGQHVGSGQTIGSVGNTGASQGDHLHFDLWNRYRVRSDAAIFYKNGWYAVNPELYLGQEEAMRTDSEIRAIAEKAIREYAFAAYDGATPKSGKRTLPTWAWSLIRHEQTPHGGATAATYTDANAIAAVKHWLGRLIR